MYLPITYPAPPIPPKPLASSYLSSSWLSRMYALNVLSPNHMSTSSIISFYIILVRVWVLVLIESGFVFAWFCNFCLCLCCWLTAQKVFHIRSPSARRQECAPTLPSIQLPIHNTCKAIHLYHAHASRRRMEPNSIQLVRLYPPCLRHQLHWDITCSNPRQLPYSQVCECFVFECVWLAKVYFWFISPRDFPCFFISDTCCASRIYFSDRLYSEEELPAEFKLFLPIQKQWKSYL